MRLTQAPHVLFLIQVFDSEERAGEAFAGASSPHVLEVGDYIMSKIEQLDRQYIDGASWEFGRTSRTEESTRLRQAR